MRPRAEILTIGDELLKGSTLNSNARFLGKSLTDLGFIVQQQTSCPDQIELIHTKLSSSLDRAQVLIVTGGLGPTPDDLTRDAIADYFGVPLEFSSGQFSRIRKLYKKFGKRVPRIVKKEAMFPRNAVPLVNRYGIALGFYILQNHQIMIVLPGVPSELENMFRELAVPLLKKVFPDVHPRHVLIFKTCGLGEPDVMRRLKKDFFKDPMEFGIYPEPGQVTVRVYAEKASIINRLKRLVKTRLGKDVYTFEEESLPDVVSKQLYKRGETVAVAESCTGGLLGGELTRIPGASRWFLGGVIAYDNNVKKQMLGVSVKAIERDGAVSHRVAQQMAEEVRKRFKATYGLSITGVAGPSGGNNKKPVGLVYMGLSCDGGSRVIKQRFWGNRQRIRERAVRKSVEFLWRHLKS